MIIRDDFAGPGGWDEGLKMLGRTDTVGFEWDEKACETAVAAGHKRVRADVSTYPTCPFVGLLHAYVASPPCTLFSNAGEGSGRDAIDLLIDGVTRMFAGEDCREEIREVIFREITLPARMAKNAKRSDAKRWSDARVADKAREDAFISSLVLEPARVILATRPPVIALEQVPPVMPIWDAYVRELRKMGYSAWAGVLCAADYGVPQTRRRAIVMASLLAPVHPPIPTHSEHGEDDDLFGNGRKKWVSMASALGWGFDHEPPTVGVGIDRPAPTVTGKAGGQWVIREADHPKWFVAGNQANAAVRPVTAPAPTILFGHASNDVKWYHERPATTVVGSFSPETISPPGYRTDVSRQNAEGGVKVTVAEGGVLQSFRADYPWQGTRGKQYEQVGNAVPPLLAAHVGQALGLGVLPEPVAA